MTRRLNSGVRRARLRGMEACVVRLGGRRHRAERGELTVPEHRSDPASRAIGLPVLRVMAGRPGGDGVPVFRLGGGPGLTNMRFACPPVLATRDVVLVGYRGVDGAVRLACPEVARALRGSGGEVLGAPSRRRVAQAAAKAAERLSGRGVDLAGYTVAEVLEDIEDARAALGYGEIDLLSESYGTRLALLYAQARPSRVRRSVLLGVNPPGRFIWDPAIVDAQLADWGRLWAASGPGRDDDLAGVISAAVERLPHRWAGLRVDVGKAKILTFAMLFQRRTGLIAIDAWQAAARGDPAGVALLCLAYDAAVPRLFTWGDFLAKAFSADYEPGVDYQRRLDPPTAVLGSPLSLLFFGGGPGWPPAPVSGALRRLRECAVESLLISGALDVSTPPQHARDEALSYLPRGRQVVIPNASHVEDMWGLQPAAIGRLITGFLDAGQAEADFNTATPALQPALHLPTVAKLAAGGSLAASAALAVAAGRYLATREAATKH